jgi:hypothetical protein
LRAAQGKPSRTSEVAARSGVRALPNCEISGLVEWRRKIAFVCGLFFAENRQVRVSQSALATSIRSSLGWEPQLPRLSSRSRVFGCYREKMKGAQSHVRYPAKWPRTGSIGFATSGRSKSHLVCFNSRIRRQRRHHTISRIARAATFAIPTKSTFPTGGRSSGPFGRSPVRFAWERLERGSAAFAA